MYLLVYFNKILRKINYILQIKTSYIHCKRIAIEIEYYFVLIANKNIFLWEYSKIQYLFK